MSALTVLQALSGHRAASPAGFAVSDFAHAATNMCSHIPWDIHPSKRILKIAEEASTEVSLTGYILEDVTGALRPDIMGTDAVSGDAVVFDPATNKLKRPVAGTHLAFARVKAESPSEISNLLSTISAAATLAEYSGARDQAMLLERLLNVLGSALLSAGRPGTRHYPSFAPSVGTPQIVEAQ